MNNTLAFAKAVSLVEYEPAMRAAAEKSTWDWQKAWTVENLTDAASRKYFHIAGLPPAQQRGEGQGMYYADLRELQDITITVSKYTLGTSFTHEMLQDNRHIKNIMRVVGDAFGESHGQVVDVEVANTFNYAWNASLQPMYDGKALLADDHALQGMAGGTYDNNLPAMGWSEDNMWLLINHFETIRNHVGLLARDKAEWLVFDPSKMKEFIKIFSSPNEPGTANNDLNALTRYKVKPLPCPHLTTTTNVFALGEKWKKNAIFLWRERFQRDMEKDNLDYHGVRMNTWQRYGKGILDFFPIVGTPGS